MVMLNCCLYNIVHFISVLAWQLFFSQFHGPLYELAWFCDSLLLCSLLETVVLVLIELHGCTLCQVEVLC